MRHICTWPYTYDSRYGVVLKQVPDDTPYTYDSRYGVVLKQVPDDTRRCPCANIFYTLRVFPTRAPLETSLAAGQAKLIEKSLFEYRCGADRQRLRLAA